MIVFVSVEVHLATAHQIRVDGGLKYIRCGRSPEEAVGHEKRLSTGFPTDENICTSLQ